MVAKTQPRTLFVSVFHPEIVRGGAQQAAYELFQGFRRDGQDAIFLASIEPGNAPALFKPGAIITGFDQRENEYLLLTDSFEHSWYRNLNVRAIRWFSEFLREMKPDVVHFHHFMTIGIDLFLVARRVLPEARLVLTLHEMLAICKANGHMVRLKDRTLCTRASPVRCNQCFPDIAPEMFQLREDWIRQCLDSFDAYITPTHFLKQRYVEWGLPAEKVHVVANAQEDYARRPGVLTRPVTPAAVPAGPAGNGRDRRRAQAVAPPCNRFAFFGQLVDVKGLLVVFEALKLYAETHAEPIVFEINGANLNFASEEFRGKFDAFLADAAALKPVVDVRFNGGYAMEDLPIRMARTDWVLVPSIWWEIFGLVVSEAFMFGKPPIVSNLGGIGERVEHDVNGLQFEVGDARSLMATLHRAATEAGLHARLSAASPRVPPVGDIVAEHLDVYRPAVVEAVLAR
jgi:glycosyltransferase involved in cell wall biosynthesis